MYKLPNGIEIYQLNKIETDFLYKEIFLEENYLKNGIELREGAVVFDVGANIGMFSLFVGTKCADYTLYAFEPVPPLYEILKLNTERGGERVKAIPLGITDHEGKARFVFYPGMSVFSGQFAQTDRDKDLLRSILLNQYKEAITDEKLLNKFVGHFLENRFTEEVFDCQVTTVSRVISEYAVDHIDLLKIDAEKSELQVLAGINEEDWEKIRQLVMEVHEADAAFLADLEKLLGSKGYALTIEREKSFSNNDIYNCYARKQ